MAVIRSGGEKSAPIFLGIPAALNQSWEKKDWWALSLVVGVALLARGLYFFLVRDQFWFSLPVVDAANYDQWAKAILAGDWLGKDVYVHSPLYAYFLALLYWVLGPRPVWVGAFQLCLGAISCGLVYLLAKRLFSRPVGLAAGLLQALYGVAVFHEGTLLTVLLIHLLNLTTLLLAYRALQAGKWTSWIWPGITLGLSVLTRPNILPFLGILAVWIWFYPRADRSFTAPLKAIAALTISVFLVVLPVTVRNAVVLHELMLTVGHGGLNFYLGNSARSTGYHIPFGELGLSASEQVRKFREIAEQRAGHALSYSQSSRYWFWEAWQEIFGNPSHWQWLLVDKVLLFFNHYEYTTSLNYYAAKELSSILRWPWVSFAFLLPFGVLGLILARKQWFALLPIYGLLLLYLFTNVSMLVSSEYRYGAMPAFLVFGGFGLISMFKLLWERRWSDAILPAAVLGIFAVVASLQVIPRDDRQYHMATAYSNLAGVLGRAGDYLGASELYQHAQEMVAHRPDNYIWLAYMRGMALLDGGQYPQALEILEQAYAGAQDDPDVVNGYATALTANRLFDQAVLMREKALQLEPRNPRFHLNLGITLMWARKDMLADRAFTQAVALEPSMQAEIARARSNIITGREEKPVEGPDPAEAAIRRMSAEEKEKAELEKSDKPLPPQLPVYQPPILPGSQPYVPYQAPPVPAQPPTPFQQYQQPYQPPSQPYQPR